MKTRRARVIKDFLCKMTGVAVLLVYPNHHRVVRVYSPAGLVRYFAIEGELTAIRGIRVEGRACDHSSRHTPSALIV